MRTTNDVWADVRVRSSRPSGWLRAAQWVTWIVPLAIMVSAYTHGGPLNVFVAKRPVMTIEQARLAHNLVYQVGMTAEKSQGTYDAAAFARDQRVIINLRGIVDNCVVPTSGNYSEYESSVLRRLSEIAVATEMRRHYAQSHDENAAKLYGDQVVMAAGMANMDYFRTATTTPVPGLPLPVHNPFPWSAFWQMYAMAWFWSLFPAAVCIALRFRGRFAELAAELKDRPWAPVMSLVFWWYGAYHYNGQDRIATEFRNRCWEFQHEHGENPSPEMARMIWERAAAPYVGGYAQAVALAQKYPQLIAVQSKRMAFVSMLAATIGTPLATFMNVVTAYAQTVRLTPAVAQVDTSRVRRTISGRTFGVMTYNGDRGFNLGTVWGIGQLKDGRVTCDAWVDFLKPTVMQASATYRLNDQLSIEGGRNWSPTAYCLPGPDNGLFPASTIGSYFPKGAADGLQAHLTTTPLTMHASAQAGLDPTATDGDIYGKSKIGPLTFQTGAHIGTETFQFGMVEVAGRGLLVRGFGVNRPDRHTSAFGTDVVYSHGAYRTGVHLEHDRWQATAERKLGTHSRLVVHLGHTTGVSGHELILKVQHGFALAP